MVRRECKAWWFFAQSALRRWELFQTGRQLVRAFLERSSLPLLCALSINRLFPLAVFFFAKLDVRAVHQPILLAFARLDDDRRQIEQPLLLDVELIALHLAQPAADALVGQDHRREMPAAFDRLSVVVDLSVDAREFDGVVAGAAHSSTQSWQASRLANGRHVFSLTMASPIRTTRFSSSGRARMAPVGHTSPQALQLGAAGMIGDDVRRPESFEPCCIKPIGCSTLYGQALKHSPQRMHICKNSGSGTLPGGRTKSPYGDWSSRAPNVLVTIDKRCPADHGGGGSRGQRHEPAAAEHRLAGGRIVFGFQLDRGSSARRT